MMRWPPGFRIRFISASAVSAAASERCWKTSKQVATSANDDGNGIAVTLAFQVTVLEGMSSLAITPPAARLWAAGRKEQVVRMLSNAATLSTVVVIIVVGLLAVLGGFVIDIAYGSSMRPAATMLLILAVSGIAQACFAVNMTMLIVSGHIAATSRSALLVLSVALQLLQHSYERDEDDFMSEVHAPASAAGERVGRRLRHLARGEEESAQQTHPALSVGGGPQQHRPAAAAALSERPDREAMPCLSATSLQVEQQNVRVDPSGMSPIRAAGSFNSSDRKSHRGCNALLRAA